MLKIPVTRNFDKDKIIGYLVLSDYVDIPFDAKFSIGYIPLEGPVEHPTKIHVFEVSLIDTPPKPAVQGDVIIGRI